MIEPPMISKAKTGYLSKQKNVDEVRRLIFMLENTFASFGKQVKVVEVHLDDEHIRFDLEISMGTKLSKIMKLKDDIAFAIASPKGEIEIYPLKGRSLLEIRVPMGGVKLKKERYKIIRVEVPRSDLDDWGKIKLVASNLFKAIGNGFYRIGSKLSN